MEVLPSCNPQKLIRFPSAEMGGVLLTEERMRRDEEKRFSDGSGKSPRGVEKPGV